MSDDISMQNKEAIRLVREAQIAHESSCKEHRETINAKFDAVDKQLQAGTRRMERIQSEIRWYATGAATAFAGAVAGFFYLILWLGERL